MILEPDAEAEALLPRVAEEILDAFGSGLLRVDASGRVVHANEGVELVLGQPRGELVGHAVGVGLRDAQMPFVEGCRRALKNDAPTTTEFRGANGAWFEARALPLGGGVTVLFRDIEDRKRIAQLAANQPTNDELFRVSQEVSPNGFSYALPIRDTTGAVVDFEWVYQNDAASRLNHLPAGRSIAGRRMLDARPNLRSAPLWQHYKRVAETGEPWQGESHYKGEDLDEWFRITVVRAGDGVSFTFEAVTDRHNAEIERQQLLLREKTARAEAEASRRHLHALFMQAPAIVSITRGPEHVFELANDATRAMVGGRDLTGKPLRGALPELAGQGFYELFDSAYASGVAFHGNEMLVDLDRSGDGALASLYVTFVLQPFREPDGSIAGLLIFAYEVTAQVRARQRVEQLAAEQARRAQQALLIGEIGEALTRDEALLVMLQACADAVTKHLDGAFAGIWTLNAKERVLEAQVTSGLPLEAHHQHARVPLGEFKIGLIAAEGLPHLTNDLLNDARLSDRAWAEREGLVAFAGYPLRLENAVLGVLAMFARAPLAADTLDSLEAAADAVALGIQRKRTEEERRKLIVALERSNRELDQFAYVASHDLKAPLRGIASLSQWIEEDVGPALSGESRENMDLLRGRVHRLEGLIDGILDYSRAGRSRAKAEPVDVQTLLDDVVELLAAPPTTRVMIAKGMPCLNVERVPFQQVFLNLIGNAVKYTRTPDGEVRVGVSDEGAFHHFTVTDNGPGIAPRYHERIWGIFQTLHARDEIEGTGIGLSVVKKIVETRGGRTWVESDEGEGSTFHVLWPKQPRESDDP